jgi:23S rRNA-/tRNA-specific pseudouridylate synthase
LRGRTVVVVAADTTTLGDVLPRLGEGADRALEEGRVFVGSRRATGVSETVLAGDEVAMYAARLSGVDAPRILAQRDGIVAVCKPAEMATVADHRGRAGTLQQVVAEMLARPADELVVTSRLDVGVSGVVLFATDEKSSARLARARGSGRYRRHYVAIASGTPAASEGHWTAPIGRDRDPRKRRAGGPGAVHASTAYAVRAVVGPSALLAAEPETGRTHQIRVHASNEGCPLYGDATYGGPTRIVSDRGTVTSVGRIALHAAWVEISSDGDVAFRVEAEIPEELKVIWGACGGAPSDWSRAMEPLTRFGHTS